MKLTLFVLVACLATIALSDSGEDLGSVETEDTGSSTTTEAVKEKPKYVKPVPIGDYYFVETFEENVIGKEWLKSKAKKEGVEEVIAKYDGMWAVESPVETVLEGDKGLVLKSKAKHHAISSRLVKSFHFSGQKPLIVQYEVKFQNPLECGGAYVKLLASDPSLNLEQFYDKTSFSIMFGPDKCGTENKYHLIIRYKHPKTGVYEEKHAKKSELPEGLFSDGKTHLFTLVLKPDNTFQMLIDNGDVNTGSLLSDLTPAINPPKEIVDPNDKKPEGWDDREKIADPDAVKPDDWDESQPKTIVDESAEMPSGWLESEPEMIEDPTAVRPEDWDDETDGEWEAPKIENPKCKGAPGCGKWSPPQVPNPLYKGKWSAPFIDNPNYQGVWEPRKIANPDYFEDTNPFQSLNSFEAVGLELWSMTDNIFFDNFIITDDERIAERFAQDSWALKRGAESRAAESSDSVVSAFLKAANEKPWIWAVVVLVVLLPVVLVVVFCCGGKSSAGSASKSAAAASSAEAKKTDAAQPDDEAKGSDEGEADKADEGDEVEDEADADDNEADNRDEKEPEEPEESAKKSPARRRLRRD